MILITRPKNEAKKLKKKIEELGYDAHIDSLSKISNINIDRVLNSKKTVLISSQRAARIFIEKYSLRPNIPILVIGNSSYQKLKTAGFSNILYKAKDSNQLLRYLTKNLNQLEKKYGSKLVYMTGSVLNQKFIKNLNAIGYEVEKTIVYKTIFKSSFNNSTVQLLKNKKINVCLIYSQQNAERLCKLILNQNLFHKCKNLLILTLSKNISNVMKKNGYLNVVHSFQPTQASLMQKLKKTILL
tara:strand:+ start:641 stop:1366 length:726 start_codon:yes stop_codon:yes gene_type:complete